MSQPTRYLAEHLITMAPDVPVHSPGVVDVVDGRVVWSGPHADAPPSQAAVQRIAGLLMPGLISTHAHTPMILLRGTGEGLATHDWLHDVMWPREARLTAEDVRWAMQLGASELMLSGITTSGEMYFWPDTIAQGAITAGLRCIVAAPLIEAPDFAHLGSVTEQIDAIRTLRSAYAGHPSIEIAVGPHSAYTLSREALAEVKALVDGDPMLVHIHVAEQPDEGDEVMAATGMTVPAYLDELGLLTPRALAAHCVWMTDDDIARFAAHSVGVAHCPASNGRHASGAARIGAMRDAGISVGLGTDGPASHDRLDLFEEMRCAVRQARIARLDASFLDARTVLGMATRDAGAALGRPDIGHLQAGACADMVALDVDGPGFAPILDPQELFGRVVWAGSPAAVRSVWVHGSHVVEDRRCTTVDRIAATREVTDRARRIGAA